MNDREFEVWQDDMCVAGTMGSNALNEIKHYAAQYEQDGPIEVYEVTRTLVDLKAASQPPKEAMSDAGIDTPEFMALLDKFSHESSCEEYNADEYQSARQGIINYINANSAPNAQLVDALKQCTSMLYWIDLESSDAYQAGLAALTAAGVEVK